MTMTALKGWIEYPSTKTRLVSTSSLLVDAATERGAYLVQAPKAGTLDKVMIQLGNINATWNATPRVSFQGVDAATGNPDGTATHYRTLSLTDGVDDNTLITTGLITTDGTDGGAKKTVTRGEQFFIVMDFASPGSYTSGGILYVMGRDPLIGCNNAYASFYSGSAWSKQSYHPSCCLVYNDASIEPMPGNTPGFNTNWNLASGSEGGQRMLVKFDCKVAGFYTFADIDADSAITLYGADGTTVIGSYTADKDIRQAAGSDIGWFWLTSELTLSRNTVYYLAHTAGATMRMDGVIIGDAAAGDAFPGGIDQYYVNRTTPGSGAWTTDTTRLPFMGLLISQLDDGAGTGGGGGGGLRLAGHGGLVA